MSSSSASTFNSNKQPSHAAHHGMRRKRSLSFCGTVAVKLIPTLNEMTDAEYFGVYYTDVEFQALRRSTMDDVMEMRDLCSLLNQNVGDDAEQQQQTMAFLCKTAASSPVADSSHTFCSRGIEHFCSAETNQRRRQTRRSYVRAILAEQDLQHSEGYQDPAALSRVASNLSATSRVEAIRKGGADAIEARRVSGMTEKMVRALQALADATDESEPNKVGGSSKMGANRSVRRPLGSVQMRSFSQNAAVA